MGYDHDAQMKRENERHQVIQQAVDAADRIIMDSSDGTVETTDYLTLRVALVLLHPVVRDTPSGLLDQLLTPMQCHVVILKASVAARDIVTSYPENHPAVQRSMLFEVASAFVRKVGCRIMGDLGRYEMDNPAQPES